MKYQIYVNFQVSERYEIEAETLDDAYTEAEKQALKQDLNNVVDVEILDYTAYDENGTEIQE